MDRNTGDTKRKNPGSPAHAHSWIWLVTVVVAISTFANVID